MTKIIFITHQGKETTTDATDGQTLLQLAHANQILGVIGECGGCLSCATCHVYVDEAWLDKLPPVQPDENTMLDGTYDDREPTSRLACQINVSPELEGLVVRLPERQN